VSRTLTDLRHYDGGNLTTYATMVRALDQAVGQVLAVLDAQGRTEHTIVIFTSDNGGERFSKTWPFTGQKTELLEGGLRVPTLLRWPARVVPQVSPQVTITMDWLPTLLAAAGTRPDAAYPSDGDNLLPLLLGTRAPYPRTLYWRYNPRSRGCGTRPRILPRCCSFIPGRINAYGFADEQMMVLDSMDLAACRILHSKLHQRYRGEEGEDHGRCGRSRWAFIPGDLLSMVAEI